jgi:acyl-[acyl-carrier-protein]-phospholipid O-acyltransferase / long-chain-fatty-acid--[acyl-carrier-protein] ligase
LECDVFNQDTWWITVIVALGMVGIFSLFHYTLLVRFPLWILRHTLYRLEVVGVEHIPDTGPALFVSNHVSHIDALLVLAAQQRRIRFLIWAPFLGVPFLRLILRLAKVIPVISAAGPRAIVQSLRTASAALANGEAVCIFAEGAISRTGFLLPFQRGFEQIVKRTPGPIIPVCLDHVWGSIFSYQGRRFFWKLPARLPYRVHVSFGTPLPPTASAVEVHQAIQEMSARSAVRRAAERRPVQRQFIRMAASHPLRPCILDANAAKPVMNYGEVLAGAKILTKRLRPLLKDDAMVGIWLPPSLGGALANICVTFLGKTAVNLNYSVTADIVGSSIKKCGIRRILTSRLMTHKVPLEPGPGVELVYLEDFRKGISQWERLRTYLGVLLLPGFVQERLLLGAHTPSDDLITVIFSSGSTGDPKGVMLTHANVAANAESMIQAVDPGPRDRLLGVLPFFHSFGFTVTLWLPLQVGVSTVFHANPLQAREIGELCRINKCTIFLTTPTFLRSFIKRCGPDDFKTVRILLGGAEKMPLSLMEEFKQKFGVTVLEGYGCTELSPAAIVNVPDFQNGNIRQLGNKPGTIGQPIPGVTARIAHKETFQDVPAGQEGMLLVYGANVMKGYLGNDELTQKKIRDGWYVTGDLAKMDEDGFITITGREERFAKVGGEMVPLEKVEEEIQIVLGSQDRLVVVTAIPDARRGERIVVLHLPLEMATKDVVKKLGERGLPNIYLPDQRDFFQVAELPILGSGKIDLKKCKQTAMDLAK